VLHFIVTDINDGKITVDANHPLAGQDVTFTVRVADIRDATAEDIGEQAQQFFH
jgi:FKBP-type peptidyl-prolyl cis-trans isomerase SlyD